MSFLSHTVSIPVWLFILMIVAILPLLINLFNLLYRFRRGDIEREEQSDMVVWKIRNQTRTAVPKSTANNDKQRKAREEKEQLIQVLKVLLREGEKGVRPKTVADTLNLSLSRVQLAIDKLIERKMVEEVTGMSGTRYYLTQTGVDYCRSKTRG